jgi:hypothetical protein
MKDQTTPKNTKGKDLALAEDYLILGPKKGRSGRLLSTSPSHSLANTSWVNRVDLYGFKNNGLDSISS